MRGRDIVSALMNEYIVSGNLLYTRGSLYRELMERFNNPRMADSFAFGSYRTLTPAELQSVRDYWQSSSVPEGFWNRTGEVPTLPLDWRP